MHHVLFQVARGTTKSNMRDYYRTDDVVFERHVLSISDEAFLLVVLINYAPCWHVESANEIKEVRTYVLVA